MTLANQEGVDVERLVDRNVIPSRAVGMFASN
jgi:hypothetical protein